MLLVKGKLATFRNKTATTGTAFIVHVAITAHAHYTLPYRLPSFATCIHSVCRQVGNEVSMSTVEDGKQNKNKPKRT